MSYPPQDPQGWQQPGGGGYGQQPGGYDPSGYGDPYAQPGGYQPAYDPTSGQPQTPISAQPGSGPPQPGSGPPQTGPLPPDYPYGQQPYGQQPYGQQQYPAQTPGYPTAPVPPKKSRTGLIIGIVAGALVLICVLGSVGAYAVLSDPDPKPTPSASASASESPSESPSPSPDPPLLAQFVDPDLREFSRNGAAAAQRCEVVTSRIPENNKASEVVKCSYAENYTVYFARYKTQEARDSYAAAARNGFNGSIINDSDTFWANDEGINQGNFVAGYDKNNNTRFLYWDVYGKPISGEIYSTTVTDAATTKTFWEKIK